MRISDWSSDVCSSDLCRAEAAAEDAKTRAFLSREEGVKRPGKKVRRRSVEAPDGLPQAAVRERPQGRIATGKGALQAHRALPETTSGLSQRVIGIAVPGGAASIPGGDHERHDRTARSCARGEHGRVSCRERVCKYV